MTPEPASRARFKVVGWAVALAMVTYLDRACLATLALEIMRDLGLDKAHMGYVYSAFALLGRTGDWSAPLLVMGGLFLVGALAWAFVAPERPIAS